MVWTEQSSKHVLSLQFPLTVKSSTLMSVFLTEVFNLSESQFLPYKQQFFISEYCCADIPVNFAKTFRYNSYRSNIGTCKYFSLPVAIILPLHFSLYFNSCVWPSFITCLLQFIVGISQIFMKYAFETRVPQCVAFTVFKGK